MEYLNEDVKKKKGQILYIGGTENQIATSAKLLDITHGSYGFSGYLANRDHQCGKADSGRGDYKLH